MDEKEINVQAFLKLLKYCEHKRTDDGVYYSLYGGKALLRSMHENGN